MKEHSDNTELFAKNTSGAPEKIEQVYYLAGLPEEYVEYERSFHLHWENVIYWYNGAPYNTLMFSQDLKCEYNAHYNTEGYTFEAVEINGHDGLYIDYSGKGVILGCVVWDNGDYILSLDGDLTKNELLDLAESAKPLEA